MHSIQARLNWAFKAIRLPRKMAHRQLFGRVALDKREGSVKGKVVRCSAGAPLRLPEKVEDQGSGNLTLNHLPVEDRSTNHRFGPKHRP